MAHLDDTSIVASCLLSLIDPTLIPRGSVIAFPRSTDLERSVAFAFRHSQLAHFEEARKCRSISTLPLWYVITAR